jgi:hypothetical protein
LFLCLQSAKTMLCFLLLSAFLAQASSSSPLDPITFSLTSFNNESCSNGELICMGSVIAGDGYLTISPDPQQQGNSSSPTLPLNRVGRVLYAHPVLAWPAIISTTFTVRISSFPNSTGAGDGMAFVFAQDHRPSPPGSYGSYLGLLDRSTEGNHSMSEKKKKKIYFCFCILSRLNHRLFQKFKPIEYGKSFACGLNYQLHIL